jgi:hypothetical protein
MLFFGLLLLKQLFLENTITSIIYTQQENIGHKNKKEVEAPKTNHN